MTPFEAFLAFLVVMGIISIPFAAIITRSRSPIGQAIAERIRRRTQRKLGPPAASVVPPAASAPPPAVSVAHVSATTAQLPNREEPDPHALIELQQAELTEMSTRLEFLERLLEEQSDAASRQD